MTTSMYGSAAGAGTGPAIFTDDVSLQVFMEHLKRLVSRVQSSIVTPFLSPLPHRPLVHKQTKLDA